MADSARHYFSWEAENYFNCLRLFLKSIRWLAWGMAIKHLWKMFFNHLILFVRKWNTLEVNNSAPPGDDGINDLSFYQIWVFMTIFLSQIDLFTVHPSYKETMHCKLPIQKFSESNCHSVMCIHRCGSKSVSSILQITSQIFQNDLA